MARMLFIISLLSLAVGCASRKTAPATNPAPSASIGSELPTLDPPEPPPTYVSGDPVTFVVFPELGYSVLIPGKDWVYEKHHTPKGSKESLDLIMGLMSKETSIVVQTYWDDQEDGRGSIFDIIDGRRYRWSRSGWDVGPEDYRVDDKGYFMEFESVRKASDGTTRRYWTVCGRLHRLPGAVVLVTGNVQDGYEEFMRESLVKVLRGIQPYGDE